MKVLTTIFILLIGQLTYGQTLGKFISSPNNSTSTILKLKKNHTFKFIVKGQVAETIRQTGKWRIENDTLELFDIRQPIYKIGLFETPTKWIVSENIICGIPKLEPDYQECLRQEW